MKAVGILLDIDRHGNKVLDERPSGAIAEHRQPAKTINASYQKRMRSELWRKKLAEAHWNAVVAFTTVNDILDHNEKAERDIIAKMEGGNAKVANVITAVLLHFSVANLQDFIHACIFEGGDFPEGQAGWIRWQAQQNQVHLLLPKHDNVLTSRGLSQLNWGLTITRKGRDLRNKWNSVATKNCTSSVLSVWGQLIFMLGSEIEACKPPRNDLKRSQRHRNDRLLRR